MSIDIVKPGVKVLTYMSINGLQFDTLFVPGLDAITEDITSASVRMRYYVVLARARNELELSYFGSGEPPIVTGIPPRSPAAYQPRTHRGGVTNPLR